MKAGDKRGIHGMDMVQLVLYWFRDDEGDTIVNASILSCFLIRSGSMCRGERVLVSCSLVKISLDDIDSPHNRLGIDSERSDACTAKSSKTSR